MGVRQVLRVNLSSIYTLAGLVCVHFAYLVVLLFPFLVFFLFLFERMNI